MQVALATAATLPDLAEDDQLLLATLADRGVAAAPVIWSSAHDWAATPLCVVRSVWDYEERRDEFVAWAAAVEASGCRLLNSADTLRWNSHKGYLLELEERGAPVVPTAFLGQGDAIDVVALAAARSWKEVVAKPCVAAGGRGLLRAAADDPMMQAHLDGLLARGDAMVQPYVRSIERDGELSLLFVDGRFTHAVRKTPATGEFRIQEQYGGQTARVVPDRDVVALGEWIVEATGHEFLYARVDVVFDTDGSPMLGELEVTEPSMYFEHGPEAVEAMAGAIEARLT